MGTELPFNAIQSIRITGSRKGGQGMDAILERAQRAFTDKPVICIECRPPRFQRESRVQVRYGQLWDVRSERGVGIYSGRA